MEVLALHLFLDPIFEIRPKSQKTNKYTAQQHG